MTANQNSIRRIKLVVVPHNRKPNAHMFFTRLFSSIFIWSATNPVNNEKLSLSVTCNPGKLDITPVPTSEPAHKFFIAVPSMIEDRDKRDAIRNSWGKDAKKAKIPLYFYIGKSNCNQVNSEIQKEAATHGDIKLTPFEDLWNNKVRKLFLAMQDAVNGDGSSHYFAFIEDGTYVHVDALLKYLNEHGTPKMYGGRIVTNNGPVREPLSIYYISPQSLPEDRFPPYAESVGFFMGRDTAIALLSQQNQRLMLHIDDVTVGCWLDRMAKENRFKPDYVNVGHDGIGKDGKLMVTGLNPKAMVQYHQDHEDYRSIDSIKPEH